MKLQISAAIRGMILIGYVSAFVSRGPLRPIRHVDVWGVAPTAYTATPRFQSAMQLSTKVDDLQVDDDDGDVNTTLLVDTETSINTTTTSTEPAQNVTLDANSPSTIGAVEEQAHVTSKQLEIGQTDPNVTESTAIKQGTTKNVAKKSKPKANETIAAAVTVAAEESRSAESGDQANTNEEESPVDDGAVVELAATNEPSNVTTATANAIASLDITAVSGSSTISSKSDPVKVDYEEPAATTVDDGTDGLQNERGDADGGIPASDGDAKEANVTDESTTRAELDAFITATSEQATENTTTAPQTVSDQTEVKSNANETITSSKTDASDTKDVSIPATVAAVATAINVVPDMLAEAAEVDALEELDPQQEIAIETETVDEAAENEKPKNEARSDQTSETTDEKVDDEGIYDEEYIARKVSEAMKDDNIVVVTDPTNATLASVVDAAQHFNLVSPIEDRLPLVNNQRLICIGDVHGDILALEEFLTIAGVYSESRHWMGGNTILVQCGDILDRGSEELTCMALLAQLSKEAMEAGGAVIVLYGNHESLNNAGQFAYTTGDREYERVVGDAIDEALQTPRWRIQYARNQPSRWATFEPGGVLAEPFFSKLKVAVKIGRTVCVHAGLTPKHLDEYGSIEDMNRIAREWVVKTGKDVTFNNYGNYSRGDEVIAAATTRTGSARVEMPKFLSGGIGGDSPVWLRDYSNPPDMPPASQAARTMLVESLNLLDADRMVMGHTVQKQINGVMDGKAWRIDVGASRGVLGRPPEVLEVCLQDGEEVVSILTRDGKVPSNKRVISRLSKFAKNLF